LGLACLVAGGFAEPDGHFVGGQIRYAIGTIAEVLLKDGTLRFGKSAFVVTIQEIGDFLTGHNAFLSKSIFL